MQNDNIKVFFTDGRVESFQGELRFMSFGAAEIIFEEKQTSSFIATVSKKKTIVIPFQQILKVETEN